MNTLSSATQPTKQFKCAFDALKQGVKELVKIELGSKKRQTYHL